MLTELKWRVSNPVQGILKNQVNSISFNAYYITGLDTYLVPCKQKSLACWQASLFSCFSIKCQSYTFKNETFFAKMCLKTRPACEFALPDLALCMASEGPSCTTGVTCPALRPLMVQVTEQMCDQFMERDEMLQYFFLTNYRIVFEKECWNN